MGWWELPGSKDDLTGDRPSDLFYRALRQIGTARAGQGRPRPTPQQLTDALARALAEDAGGHVADAGAFAGRTLTLGALRADPAAGDPAMVAGLLEGLRQVADAYEERWERKPRMAEVLWTLSALLGPSDAPVVDPPAAERDVLAFV
jgi:hypothetical protein